MPRLLRQVLQSHRRPKSSGMEMVLLTNLKCDALTGRINRSYLIFPFPPFLPPFAFSLTFHPPFFIYSFSTAYLFIASLHIIKSKNFKKK
jgi:hypothetical protein